MATSFTTIYDRFFGKITDDMYLEWTEEDTYNDIKNILVDAIPLFEFPRFRLYDYDLGEEQYNVDLTQEEINIIATLMYMTWLQRQIASVENIRMKYSGSDFKMTSQANHLSKLLELKKDALNQNQHLQRLYRRRRLTDSGYVEVNWDTVIQNTVIDE